MPNSRQTSVMASPSRSRATKRRRSSITELAFHGIDTSRGTKAESVTHVSGTFCHLCLGPLRAYKSSTSALFCFALFIISLLQSADSSSQQNQYLTNCSQSFHATRPQRRKSRFVL